MMNKMSGESPLQRGTAVPPPLKRCSSCATVTMQKKRQVYTYLESTLSNQRFHRLRGVACGEDDDNDLQEGGDECILRRPRRRRHHREQQQLERLRL